MIRRGETQGEHLAIPLDVLKASIVPPLPVAPWQAEILEARKAAATAGDHWFRCYRVGGHPVDFEALDLAGVLGARGINVSPPKPYKGATKWRCQCPLAHEHSGGVDDDCAAVIKAPGQWPAFHCAHSHHAHLNLQDVIELLWGRP